MDKMDRMLHSLPVQALSPELASNIQASIHLRHLRRRVVRWTAASLLALSGLWLISPAAAWLSSYDLYSSGTPWLTGSADYLNLESVQILDGLWNGMFSLQNTVDSSLAISIWIGVILLCLAIFFAIDGQAFQTPAQMHMKSQG